MVVPQGRDAVGGWDTSGIYQDGFVVVAAHNQLLAPVTEDVGNSAWVVLRPVVTLGVWEIPAAAAGFVWLVDGAVAFGSRTVEIFVQKVTVPVDALVQVTPADEVVAAKGIDKLVGHGTDPA